MFALLVCNYLKMQNVERMLALNLSNKWGLNNSTSVLESSSNTGVGKKNKTFSLHKIFCLHQILELKIPHKRFRDVTSFFFS